MQAESDGEKKLAEILKQNFSASQIAVKDISGQYLPDWSDSLPVMYSVHVNLKKIDVPLNAWFVHVCRRMRGNVRNICWIWRFQREETSATTPTRQSSKPTLIWFNESQYTSSSIQRLVAYMQCGPCLGVWELTNRTTQELLLCCNHDNNIQIGP